MDETYDMIINTQFSTKYSPACLGRQRSDERRAEAFADGNLSARPFP